MEIILVSWGIALAGMGLGMLAGIQDDKKHAAAAAASLQGVRVKAAAAKAAARQSMKNSTTGYIRIVCKNTGWGI